jgi:protein-S-isoprenylcysteine O-methyltransferase Ste14
MTLFAAGVLLWGASVILDRRTREHLDTATMIGVREISGGTDLIEEGLYGRIRHPRYLSLMVAATGWAMMANHGASYLMVAALIPALWLVISIEEDEMEERFGEAWLRYCERVPALIPRARSRQEQQDG